MVKISQIPSLGQHSNGLDIKIIDVYGGLIQWAMQVMLKPLVATYSIKALGLSRMHFDNLLPTNIMDAIRRSSEIVILSIIAKIGKISYLKMSVFGSI